MKQAQGSRKQRGRSSPRQNSKGGGAQGNRSEQKIRGNPKQLIEKYKTQAREALQAGDRVQAEYFFQFADHYFRVLSEARANQAEKAAQQANQRRGGQNQNQNQNAANGSDEGQGGGGNQRRRGRRGAPAADNAEVSAPDNAPDGGAQDKAGEEAPQAPQLALDGDAAPKKPRRRGPAKQKLQQNDEAQPAANASSQGAEGTPAEGEAV